MDACAAITTSPEISKKTPINTSGRLPLLATLSLALSLLIPAPSQANFDNGLAAFGAGRLDEARIEWQKCANKGHNISRFLLGQLYEEGQGVEPDIVLAHKWYCLAASHGYDEAISYCARAERAMTEEQKKASYRLLQATMPSPAQDAESSSSRQPIASPNDNDDTPTETDAAITAQSKKPAPIEPAVATMPAHGIDAPVSSPAAALETASSRRDASAAKGMAPATTVADASSDLQLSGQSDQSGDRDAAQGVNFDQHDEDTLTMQKLLGLLGHYRGEADGLMGRNTRLAIVAFKTQVGLAADDKIDAATVSAIRQQVANIDEELTSAPLTTGSAVESSLVKPKNQADAAR